MENPIYKEINFEDINYLINGDLLLLVTATDLETSNTHKLFTPFEGHNEILRIFISDITLFFGKMGNYNIAHVQCGMGSMARESSIMTVTNAINLLKVKVVIMVGIAFGVDPKKQNIGDVLISETVIPYNSKRVGTNKTIPRGIEGTASKVLFNRFRNVKTTWEHILPNHKKANLITTRLLSGEELIDNIEYRNELVKENPESKGGEMEGAGIFSACDGKADWIIIKGICDFADGKKSRGKKVKQTIAINSALSLCMELFNSNSAFDELGISPNSKHDLQVTDFLNLNNILFDIYDSSKEQYYIKRDDDVKFIANLNQFGIWIHGPTGCGKSNMIIRNLQFYKKEFIQVNLACCVGMDVDAFFIEILYDIGSKIIGESYKIQPNNFNECIDSLIELLNKHYLNKELVIFIEEIPFANSDIYKQFTDKLFSLLITKNLQIGLEKVRFVLSSINSPKEHFELFQQKIHQQLSFIPMNYWSTSQIEALIELIEKSLLYTLPKSIKIDLISDSKGSPRFIKKFFRSVFTLSNRGEENLRIILVETKRELS